MNAPAVAPAPDHLPSGSGARRFAAGNVHGPSAAGVIRTVDSTRVIGTLPGLVHAHAAPPAPAAPSPSLIADELWKLAELQSEGILTSEEFAAQKAKLLAR